MAGPTLPVECVTFTRGSGPAGRVWRYATADVDVTLDGVTYRAAALARGAIRRAQESAQTSCTLTLATATPFVQDWLGGRAAPDESAPVIGVTVRRAGLHADGSPAAAGDADAPPDGGLVFVGAVAGLEVDGPTATLACESLLDRLERDVPRLSLALTCPWALYDARCGVDPAAVAAPGVLVGLGTAATGPLAGLATVTVALAVPPNPPAAPTIGLPLAPDPERFDGGQCVWGGGTAADPTRRTAILQADLSAWPTVVCVVQGPPPLAFPGEAMTLLPACQKTFAVCRDRFGNGRRFGGFDRLPHRNILQVGLL
ncbi:hypothetical protein tb265_39110 [Gemmatimonadetes bacterium T265]|nr:hypothetical protein tb265_39110 [Gemmatimonadetes bacterium T265]